MTEHDWIHRALDGDRDAERQGPEGELAAYREPLELLEQCRVEAPPDLLARVMQELPSRPEAKSFGSRWRTWLGLDAAPWLAPLAGAVAALLMAVGVGQWTAAPAPQGVAVRFELHAPAAEKVELVGTFNNWKPGDILLLGPDASGHWTATVEVPAGRHEYQFLVDGSEWLADPNAPAHRPDGFGRMNALLEL